MQPLTRWLVGLPTIAWALAGGFTSAIASGDELSAGTPSTSDKLADVDLLQPAYEALHPGLYRYNSLEVVQAHIEQLRHELTASRSMAEEYLAFSRFAATVRCGHTYANFYKQSPTVQRALFERPDRVPSFFVWLHGYMVVTQDFTPDHRLPRATQVVAINGVPTATILAQLLTVARADGSNDAKRIALVQVQGLDRYESFDIFYPLLFPPTGPRYALTAHRPGTSPREQIIVSPETDAQRLNHRVVRSNLAPGWSLTFPRQDPAVLRMPTWALYQTHWDWRAYLADAFATLHRRGTTHLVFDIRGNEGGLDVGNAILPYLVDHPMTLDEPQGRVRYRSVPNDLRPYLDTWDRHFLDWGDDAQLLGDGFYALSPDSDAIGVVGVKPASPHFAGRVFVFIDAMNSSATLQFAQRVTQPHLATLVGQATGGNQRGINGGAFFSPSSP